MKNKFDISDFVDYLTEEKVIENLVNRVIARRKELKISQKDLAFKSGVSYESIRRFETTGEISLKSLIQIAKVLNSLEDFNKLFVHTQITNLKDIKLWFKKLLLNIIIK